VTDEDGIEHDWSDKLDEGFYDWFDEQLLELLEEAEN
tara:strand:+ start:77 stop:187 length:111 start_codon:yes stop_codon:yes gene_type:complete